MADIVPVPAPIPQAGVPAADQPLLDAQLPGMTPPTPGPVAAGPPMPASMILPPADVPGPPVATSLPGTVVPGTAPPAQAPVTDPLALGRQAMADQRDANADGQKAAKEEADAQQAADDAKAKLAADQAVEMQARQAEQAEQQQASDQARARLVQLADKADSDVANYKFTDWQDTVPTGKKIRLAIGAMLAGFGGSSDPLAQINKLTAQHFEQQKAELSSKEAFAGYRRQGITDFDRHVDDQRMSLEFQERNFRESMAKEIEAQALRSGNPVVAARGARAAAAARAEGSAKLMNSVGTYTKSREEMIRADQLARKGRGGAGGGRADALSAFSDAAGKLKPGDPITPEVVKLGIRAGLKPNQVAAEAEKYRGSGDKSALERNKADLASGTTYDPKRVVYVDGKPAGLAASPRNVDQIGVRLDKYQGAVRALEALQNEKQIDQFSAPYKRAALAVASITNAPASDKSTELEEGTLKNYGFLSRDAIQQTLDEAKTRLNAMKGHLQPLPAQKSGGGDVPAGAVVGKMNGQRGYVLNGKFTAL